MKKIVLSLLMLCMAAAMWADNVITYTATSQLEETLEQGQGGVGGLYIRGFNLPIQSHTFSNGRGTITFSGEVTTIKPYAFYGCTELTGITIPNSVTSVDETSFEGCNNIKSVTWNARDCSCKFYETIKARRGIFNSSRSKITSFTFGPEVEVIPDYICRGMSSLTSITIPNSVKEIGLYAFYNCSRIPSITIPDSVESIWGYAFSGCSFTSITLPNSVQHIGDYAFYGCSNLAQITIPNGVRSIHFNTFEDCSRLASVDLGQVDYLGSEAFKNCTGLRSITIPTSLTEWISNAFVGCTNIMSVTWNARNGTDVYFDIDTEEYYWSSDKITSFTFGPEVEAIPAYLCANTRITSVTIPNSVVSIPEGAFSGCKRLSSVTLSNTLTEIEDDAFYGCSVLSTITLPATLLEMGSNVFAGCTGLQELHCQAAFPPDINSTVFKNVDATIPIYVPVGTANAYRNATGWKYFSNFIEESPLAIESLEATQPGIKLIENGQVVILRDGKTYNMLGKLIIN